MNLKEKGMFDRFWLALGSAAITPPSVALPIVSRDRIVAAGAVRQGPQDAAPDVGGACSRIGWAT